MDFVNKFTGGDKNTQQTSEQNVQGSSSGEQKSGGFLGGIGDKLNSAAGGGKESEKNEDYLDKGMLSSSPHRCSRDLHTRRRRLCPREVHGRWCSGQRGMLSCFWARDTIADCVLQSAVEQAKDEQISDYIRSTYKSSTGSDVPIKDKETRFG
jgi:hypothetical protein